MGQKDFFDVERRLEAVSAKGDPLETIKKIVRWQDFRADIEAVTALSDEHTECLIRDRLHAELEDPVPEATRSGCFARRWRRPGSSTSWRFGQHLEAEGRSHVRLRSKLR
jgi:hypothetical protein